MAKDRLEMQTIHNAKDCIWASENDKARKRRTVFRASRPVQDRAVICGSRRIWSLPLEATDCSLKCLKRR